MEPWWFWWWERVFYSIWSGVMGPLRLNRRRFLGYSAAAGLAMSQPIPVEGGSESRLVKLGVIGAGNRGTSLIRSVLELPGVQVTAIADGEGRHRQRAQGIIAKATGASPQAYEEAGALLERDDVEAVLIALPCDLHFEAYAEALRAGKHLYAEKPLAIDLGDCERLMEESSRRPSQVFHVGYQRRSNPRFQEAARLIQEGELGEVLSARGQWISSNGPMRGHGNWLSRRERSGDWMVEQAVHVWDLLNGFFGGLPESAFGFGRRDLFRATEPDRDVTDQYTVVLKWARDITVTFTQSWVDPADDAFTGNTLQIVGSEGGLDLRSGVLTYRDRNRPRRTLGVAGPTSDTPLALSAFLAAVRAPGEPPPAPVTLEEARDATRVGLLARLAVDLSMARAARLDEIRA